MKQDDPTGLGSQFFKWGLSVLGALIVMTFTAFIGMLSSEVGVIFLLAVLTYTMYNTIDRHQHLNQ